MTRAESCRAVILDRICPEGGTVLDPFTGSCSTGAAAMREGRRFVGAELSDPYVNVAEQRLFQAAQQTRAQADFVLAGRGDE